MVVTRDRVQNGVHARLFVYLYNHNNYRLLTKTFFPFGYDITYNKQELQELEYNKL